MSATPETTIGKAETGGIPLEAPLCFAPAEEGRRAKPGILRLDIGKSRRSSGGSVEFRAQPQLLGEDYNSPNTATPPYQLSVTWAACERKEIEPKFNQMQSDEDVEVQSVSDQTKRSATSDEKLFELSSNLTSPVADVFGLPTFPNRSQQQYGDVNTSNKSDEDDEDEDDYSVSVSAIMQRRASVRGYKGKRGSRNSRRASSPMDHILDTGERRRSSVYTTSSDEGTNPESTQEQIFENIRLHKEVIQSVKLQTWPIRKKVKLVRQAKKYVAQHEGALQERFAMSRSTKDLWARFKIVIAARWRHWRRETASFLTVLIPWELRIKEIESHFGSGVASYFTFLRWLMWVNIMIAIPLVAFVIGPEYFATKHDEVDPRKKMSDQEFKEAGNLFTIWEFEGYLKYSPMFYGYYSSFSGASSLGYKLPLAYFLTAVVVYIYSFVATLRKMAENSRNSKLSSKDDECTFSWKLFTGWDFMIGHAETAHNRVASVVVGFKEALLEEAEKKKDNRNWRIILQRILVNVIVVGLLAASGYTVVALVNNAENLSRTDNWLSRNAVNVTMTLISFFLPMIFEAIGLFENWHPRQQLRLQLARIMILNLLNLYSLMFSFIYKINSKEKPLQELKIKNETATEELAQLTSLIEGLVTAAPNDFTMSTLDYNIFSNDDDFVGSSSTISSNDLFGSSTENLFVSTAAALYGSVKQLRCFNVTLRCSKPRRVQQAHVAVTTSLLLLATTPIPPLFSTELTEPSTTFTISTLPATTLLTTDTLFTTETDTTTMLPNSASSSELNSSEYTPTQTITHADETTTTEAGTTPLPMSSTTVRPPVNDSFFEYYDYFAGMPMELSESNIEGPTEMLSYLGNLNRRVKRAIDTKENSSSLWRRQNNFSNRKQHLDMEFNFTTNDYDSTSEPSSTSIYGTSETTPSAEQNNSSSSLASQEQLQRIFEYFIHGPFKNTTDIITSTEATSLTTEPSTLPTEAPTSATETTSEVPIDKSTAPFYIEEESIVNASEFFTVKADEVNTQDLEFCVRTVCEEVSIDILSNKTKPRHKVSTLTPLQQYEKRLIEVKQTLSTVQTNLTNMCWETSLGQELSKVIVFDGIMSIIAPLCIDFLRALFVRYVNQKWCWDMEKTFPQYGDFKIAENILTLINNQGQVWMGIFFSPGVVLINLVKLVIMMYFRSWIVLTCNVPHEVVFKASKSNNFYLTLLLTMLFLCVLPVSYAIVWLRPSWHCGPFSDYNRISEFITNTTRNALPKQLHEPLDYLTSSSTVIPLLLLLILIIYYLVSLTGALREANQDLHTQLQKEREEERKKIFKVPETKSADSATANLTNRWRKVLEASSPVTPTAQPPDFEAEEYKNQARKELISRIMKKALRKGSATSDDDSVLRHGRDEDDTDTEHHDSLPHDEESRESRFPFSRLQQIRRTRKPSLVDIVQIAQSEKRQDHSHATIKSTPSNKEKPLKGHFKIDKQDKNEIESEQTKVNDDNDPDTNSRIVNERRQSLLYKKYQDHKGLEVEEQCKELEKTQLPSKSECITSSPLPTENISNFEIVNEKKMPHNEEVHQDTNIFKLKRPKLKVFNFDEKSNEKHDKQDTPHSELVTTPPSPLPKQTNPEKLVNLSRQGRKKINSFLALVRETVNSKRAEGEDQSQAENSEKSILDLSTSSKKPGVFDTPQLSKVELPQSNIEKHSARKSNTETDSTQSMPKPASTSKLETRVSESNIVPSKPLTVSTSQTCLTMPQDLEHSIRSEIPTITISTTSSEECILEPEMQVSSERISSAVSSSPPASSSSVIPEPVVNIIKINIEDEK